MTPAVDVVGGISYDRYEITKAEEFNAARGVFEYPKGGSDSFNWQSARRSGATPPPARCTPACPIAPASR